MNPISLASLASYWSMAQVEVSALILMNILGALLLGMMVGYERSYHGRAAGIRTYGLVCMASAAVTVIVGYPQYWFGGLAPLTPTADPTRVIQGILTGIGFLGAGVIMKEGLNISGLTTAASIWASSAIGILCGSGFYLAAITLTVMSSAAMVFGGYIENWLPSRHAVSVILSFRQNFAVNEAYITQLAGRLGFRVAEGSTTVASRTDCQEWHLVFLAASNQKISIAGLAEQLHQESDLHSFHIALARN